MYKKIFAIGTGALLILAVLTYALAFSFGGNFEGMVITPRTINYFGQWEWNFYELDVFRYFKSIENSFDPKQFIAIIPKFPQLPTQPTNWTDIPKTLNFIAKILVVFIPNILVFMLNLLLWPIKLLIFPVHVLSALLGVDSNYIEVINVFETMYSLQIPQIPYW